MKKILKQISPLFRNKYEKNTKTNNHFTMKGYFNIKVFNNTTNTVTKEYSFCNLITDKGLDMSYVPSGITGILIGKGNSTPSFSDLNLTDSVTSNDVQELPGITSELDQVRGRYFTERRFTTRFQAGSLNGTYTEIGTMFYDNLFSRALILDNLGNPTALTILADEYLDVKYTLRRYLLEDIETTITLPSGHTIVSKPIRITSVNATDWSGNYAGNPHVTVYSGSSLATSTDVDMIHSEQKGDWVSANDYPYLSGSFTHKKRYVLGLDSCNIPSGLIDGLMIHLIPGSIQMTINPPIPKDNTRTISFDIEYSWGRD